MNARKLKEAFVFRGLVFSDDKDKPAKEGLVKTLIYTLSDSGKKQAWGEILPLKVRQPTVTVHCRHIHYVKNEPEKKLADAEPDEHTQNIRTAFLNVLPVTVRVPNVPEVRGNIKSIIYWRNDNGNMQCSAEVIDINCPKSSIKARLKYISVDGVEN